MSNQPMTDAEIEAFLNTIVDAKTFDCILALKARAEEAERGCPSCYGTAPSARPSPEQIATRLVSAAEQGLGGREYATVWTGVHDAIIEGQSKIDTLCDQLAAANARAEEAEKQRDEFKRLGQQFEHDARKHFDQGCQNLRRAEAAEAKLAACAAAGFLDERGEVRRVLGLTLDALRVANVERARQWNPTGAKVPLSFAMMELAGEVGEACNAAKKLARHDLGLVGGTADAENLKDELADVVICADLAALKAGIDLGLAVVEKFNKTSEKHGFTVKLGEAAEAARSKEGGR